MSGLSRMPGKHVWVNTHRGFESRPFRQKIARPARLNLLCRLAALICCTACSIANGPAAPAGRSADVTVLMMGNSHSSMGQLPRQLGDMLSAGLSGKTVAVVVAPGWMFLSERPADLPSMELLRSRPWTAVVLQGQPYSASGRETYSTAEAEALIRSAREAGARPVLFPEWPRLGVAETQRIHDIHTGIAAREPACVAAVGQAWALALQRHPRLRLHAPDGNHATTAGAHLAALMLYAAITGNSPHGLPDQASGPGPEQQRQLRQVAADTLSALPQRAHCTNHRGSP
jgi:hypothetical protein